MAGRAPEDGLLSHRPPQDRPEVGHRGDVVGLRQAARHPPRRSERQGRDHRRLRALHDLVGRRARVDAAPEHQARALEPDRHRALPGRVLQPRQEHEARRGLGGGDLRAHQLRAAGGARQGGARARRQRPPHRAPGRLAVAVRLRPARERHPPRAQARRGYPALPHRRRAARGLPGAVLGDGRDDFPHQDPRAHGRGREAPAAGRAHQDAHARRRGDRAAPLDATHRPRREARDAHLRPRGAAARLQGPGLHRGREHHLAEPHQAARRNPAGDGPHRIGQDHHALHDAQAAGAAGGERLHHRGSDRDGRSAREPDAGADRDRPHLRRRGARPHAPGPGHHHDRRDP